MNRLTTIMILLLSLSASCGHRNKSVSVVEQADSTASAAGDAGVEKPAPTAASPVFTDTVPFADTLHTAETSLDVEGVYTGMLPCADCPGIKVVLDLKENNRFNLKEMYEGGNELITSQSSGKWKVERNTLTLEPGEPARGLMKYKVEENRLRMLAKDGQLITGALSEKYILNKKT